MRQQANVIMLCVSTQLPQLRASLTQAEADRTNVEQRITVAEARLGGCQSSFDTSTS